MNHDPTDIRKDLSKYASSIYLVSSGASHVVLFVDDDTKVINASIPLLRQKPYSKHDLETIRLMFYGQSGPCKIIDVINSHYLNDVLHKKETK